MKRTRVATLNDLSSKARRRCMTLLSHVRQHGCAFVRSGASRRDARRLYRAGLVYVAISKYRPWMPEPWAELKLFDNEDEMRRWATTGWCFPVLRAHKSAAFRSGGSHE